MDLTQAPTRSYREALLRLVLHVQERQKRADPISLTKANVIAAAMSLFTKAGYTGTSMRDIAGKVGIKASSLYSHCPGGKEELLRLGMGSILDQFQAFVLQDVSYDLDAAQQLRAVVTRHVRWQLEQGETAVAWDAAISQVGVSGVLPEDALAEVRTAQVIYFEYLVALVDELGRGPVRAESVAAATLLLCNGAHRFLPVDGDAGADPVHVVVGERVWTLVRSMLSNT